MEAYLPLIIQLVAGLIGGNAAGAAMKDKSLGPLGNSIAGLVGGGVLGQIIMAFLGGGGDVTAGAAPDMAQAAGGLDMGAIIGSLVGGGGGGAALTAIIGALLKR
ncbi:hypothetical protein [Marinivivus vitaminiproducens]|uniref:hypothetical protein n=1 Tax=Marinivivus vitaminiproducens TaxID=3035935 RepID=UPI0027A4CA3F|nr:hypothetical protein P4R82_06815 [Geminicoccaceae bacterium SCSIO 64248]